MAILNYVPAAKEKLINPDGTPTARFQRFLSLLPGASPPLPIVSGSKGGNAALASLITALANAGIITDTTT